MPQHIHRPPPRGPHIFAGLKYSGASGQGHPYFPVVQFIGLQYSVLGEVGFILLYAIWWGVRYHSDFIIIFGIMSTNSRPYKWILSVCFGWFYIHIYYWDIELLVVCPEDTPTDIYGVRWTITKSRSELTSWQTLCCLFQTRCCFNLNPLSYGNQREANATSFPVITITCWHVFVIWLIRTSGCKFGCDKKIHMISYSDLSQICLPIFIILSACLVFCPYCSAAETVAVLGG